MTNPTSQEIIEAYDDLARLAGIAIRLAIKSEGRNSQKLDVIDDLHSALFKALSPKHAPTMVEVEWDDDKHYLAEAEHDVYGQVIMLGLDAGGLIEFIIPSRRDFRCDTDRPGNLTPTGKRYTLTEVQE